MMKKFIVALVVVVVGFGLVFATLSYSENKNTTKNSTTLEKQQNLSINKTTDKSNQNQISAVEAKKIASDYIKESGATSGQPKLVKQDSKMVYIVPVIINGENVGEIYIDALTGKNLGGAGGST